MKAPSSERLAVNHSVTPQLIALSEGPNLALDKPIVLIGRHQECDIQIPSRKISRRHCCVAQVADHLVIRDLGSTNGVRINGIKVLEGHLQPNDELMIGNMRYQLKWGAAADVEPGKNGIKAGGPHHDRAADSLEMPMPLPDVAMSHPVLQAKARPTVASNNPEGDGELASRPLTREVPDDVRLVPLDPPPLSG